MHLCIVSQICTMHLLHIRLGERQVYQMVGSQRVGLCTCGIVGLVAKLSERVLHCWACQHRSCHRCKMTAALTSLFPQMAEDVTDVIVHPWQVASNQRPVSGVGDFVRPVEEAA